MTGEQTHLTVMVFPVTQTLPLFAAQARGYFEKRGLNVELKPAPNSEEQRAGLAVGRYPIVHGAADQCVELVEAAKVDAMIVAGGDIAIHEAGAPFRRFEAMRDDKTMAAAILNPPFAIHGRRAGLKDMGAVVDTIGPYLGTVPYVLRSWANANADTLVGYLAGCIEGLRWILDPTNK